MSKIICFRPFRGKAINGYANIPYGCDLITIFKGNTEYVSYPMGDPICIIVSQTFTKHFSRNDDGNGLYRGKLAYAIAYNSKGSIGDEEENILRNKYYQYLIPYKDTILFNKYFFDAPIKDLEDIANLLHIDIDKEVY